MMYYYGFKRYWTIDEQRFAVNKLLFLFEKKYNPTVCSTMWNQYMYIWNQI